MQNISPAWIWILAAFAVAVTYLWVEERGLFFLVVAVVVVGALVGAVQKAQRR